MKRYVTWESVFAVAASAVIFVTGYMMGESKVNADAARAAELKNMNKMLSEALGDQGEMKRLTQEMHGKIVPDREREAQMRDLYSKTKP